MSCHISSPSAAGIRGTREPQFGWGIRDEVSVRNEVFVRDEMSVRDEVSGFQDVHFRVPGHADSDTHTDILVAAGRTCLS